MANGNVTVLASGVVNTTKAGELATITGSAQVTQDLTVDGDLTVAGDIVSRGTIDVVTSDNFIDLNNGYANSAALSGGITVQLRTPGTFNSGQVQTFTAANTTGSAATINLTVATVPANGESITLTNNNRVYTINFVNTGGVIDNKFTLTGTGAALAETASIDINTASSNTQALLGGILRTLVASITNYSTAGAAAACNITATNSSAELDLALGGAIAGSKITAAGITAGGGQSPTVIVNTNGAGTTLLEKNDIIAISGANDGGNDGIFVVSSVNGSFPQTVRLMGTGSVSVPPEVPFAQSNFQTDAVVSPTPPNCTLLQICTFVQCASDGTSFADAGGSPYAIGKLLTAYADTGTLSDLLGNNKYTEAGSGAVDLQTAYSNGQTINITSADLAISTVAAGGGNGDFKVDGGGAFDVSAEVATLSVADASTATAPINITIPATVNDAVNRTLLISADNNSTGDSILDINATSTGGDGNIDIDAKTAIDMDVAAAGQIDIQTTAAAATVNIATGGAAITTNIGNAGFASNVTIDAGTGTANISAGAASTIANTDNLIINVDDAGAGGKNFDVQHNGASKLKVETSLVTSTTNIQVGTASAVDMQIQANLNDGANKSLIIDAANAGGGDAVIKIGGSLGTAGYVDAVSSPLAVVSAIAGEAIATGDYVAVASDTSGGKTAGRIYKIDKIFASGTPSVNDGRYNFVGVATAPGSIGNPVLIQTTGTTGGSGLSAGQPLYISGANAISATPPSGSNDVIFKVGFAISASQWIIQPQFIAQLA